MGLESRRAVVCVLEGCPLNVIAPPYHFHIHLLGTANDNRISPAALQAVATILGYFRNKGWAILIHCGAGIERSPLAVAWYLANNIAAQWLPGQRARSDLHSRPSLQVHRAEAAAGAGPPTVDRASMTKPKEALIVQRVLSGGRITLPEEARKALKLKPNDYVLLEVLAKIKTVKVTPAKVVPR